MDPFPPSFKAVLEQLNDGVYFVDPHRTILYWNQAAERITGYRSEQVTGQCCASNILMHVNHDGELLCLGLCPLAHTLADCHDREAQVYLHHADGHRVPVTVRVVPFRAEPASPGEEGEVIGAVEIFSENNSLSTALSRIEALQREVMLDPLTGVGNRRMIQSRLTAGLLEWEKRSQPFGVLMADIDHFKQVNDTFGHAIGDKVLKMVTASLSSGLRTYDYIGRWGGEEFLVLVANVDEVGLRGIAERLRMLVERSVIFLDQNDRRPDRSVAVTVSLGGAIMRPGETLDSLIQTADRNLYECKASGRNRVKI
jgi:diguanylate cyclase (GGDEF)-like protein/PAS domain S-box-containing protein